MSVILLAHDAQGHGSAWRLVPPDKARDADRQLGDRALDAWTDADLVAAVCVPLSPATMHRPSHARVAATTGGPPPPALNGRSFGLAFLVESLGHRLDLAPAGRLACTGEVLTDGTVREVGGIAEKMHALLAFNRSGEPEEAIERVIVPERNVAAARTALGERVPVTGVRTASDAALAAFGEALHAQESAILARRPAAAARRMLELAIADHERFLPWKQVAMLAEVVVAVTSPGTRDHRHALIARDIALRHFGRPTGLENVTWADILAEPPLLRLRLVSHFVQGAADGCVAPWAPVRDQALALIVGKHGEGEARVRGAVGRLLAAWGQYDEACVHLAAAVDDWAAGLHVPETSIPACEWLRAARLADDPLQLAAATGAVEECLAHPEISELSRVHLCLALGRDAALAGDTERARLALAGVTPRNAVAHSVALRWLAIGGLPATPSRAIDQDLVRLARGEAAGPSLADDKYRPDWARIQSFAEGPGAWRHWRY